MIPTQAGWFTRCFMILNLPDRNNWPYKVVQRDDVNCPVNVPTLQQVYKTLLTTGVISLIYFTRMQVMTGSCGNCAVCVNRQITITITGNSKIGKQNNL